MTLTPARHPRLDVRITLTPALPLAHPRLHGHKTHISTKKKPNPYWIRLEEAATYSPT